MININKFTGLVAAPFTPMDEKGNINYSLIPDYYKMLEKNGIKGAFINGSTGEGPSLTMKEKQLQTEAWAACSRKGGKVRIISLVGGTSYKECIENAIFSKEAGAAAIAVVAPYYFRPPTEDILAEFCAKVGESVPEMPLYFYHIPELTGVNLSMHSFLRKVTVMVPGFTGIKFTHNDMMDLQLCLSYKNGAYDILWGHDECLLPALAAGCRGAVGSTYNYAAPLYHKLINAFENDMSEARRLQNLSVSIVSLLGKYGGMATGKAFMKYIGLDCGNFRSPVVNMDPELYGSFECDVRSLNIDGYFSVR